MGTAVLPFPEYDFSGENMYFIKNANVVLETGILWNGNVIIENDIIKDVGRNLLKPDGAEEVDAEGLYVGPGFVDIHNHGGDGALFYKDPQKVADYFLKRGTTTILATLYYDMSKDEFLDAIEMLKEFIDKDSSSIKGIYMEGPYMNPKYGAMPEKNKWAGEIKREEYLPLINAAKGIAKVWSIAPEREGIENFVSDLRKEDPFTVISIGHSEASPSDVEKIKKYRIGMQTHSTNATGQPASRRGTRSFGPDEVCLYDSEMYAEIISDSVPLHVSGNMQRLILKVKGIDKVILITDSNVCDVVNPNEEEKHITDLMFDANGKLAGSKLTMDQACRNVMANTPIGITEAFLLASRNPARVIGMENSIGSIEKGKKANLVFVDHMFNVDKVIFNGKFV